VEHQGKAVLNRGTKLGTYAIERLIGVGSMGAVYEGVQSATGKRFAIKVLSPALAAVPTARARFMKEATLTAGLRHAHVIEVADVGEDAGHCYFVMELLEGEDLSHRLGRSGPLSAAEAADILRPVCNAIAEAHRRGITHRDLKPSNIFLAIRERRLHPVVLDFGIANDGVGESPGDVAGAVAGVATQRAVFGTPYYLAPEQVRDHQAASAASDQHALGVILYECLTGKPPYGGDSLEEVFRAIVAGNPAPPSTRRPDLPQSMDSVVRRALNSDPKRRFASVAELGLALYPFASKAAAATPEPYRRPPTSPAIAVEAATPSLFVKTLTPEVEALDSAWFEAGESPPESEADQAIDSEPPLPTDPPEAFETVANGRGKWAFKREWIGAAGDVAKRVWIGAAGGVAKRVWIGAAGGVAIASLALVLVVTRGSASGPPQATATPALVQIAPEPAKPVIEEPPVEPMPAAAVVRPPARAPAPSDSPAPALPAATPSQALAATAPTPAPSEPPAPAPSEPPPAAPSALPAAAPSELPPPVPAERPTAARSERPTPTPSERPTPAPSERPTAARSERPTPVRERPAPVPSEPSASASAPSEPSASGDGSAGEGKPRARKSVEKPRARAGGVRLQNGVPLLD